MKLSEMYEQRTALVAERDALIASDSITVEQEARGLELANQLDSLNGQIKAAQLRERFATQAAVQTMDKVTEERATEQRATAKYRDQFINYMRGQGPEPELREVNTGTGSGILIPKVYEDGILKYLMANTVVRNLADIRTGVQGYPTVRWNNLTTNQYTSAWTPIDTGTTAAQSIDPSFTEQTIPPLPCLPYTQVSRQSLIQSNFDLEAEVVDTLQRQLAKNLEWAYVGGGGASASPNPLPTGIFSVNANANITTATGTAGGGRARANAIAGGISLANLQDMRYNKLPAAYWGSACWIIPQDAYASIAALTANQVPLFIPSADYSVSIQNAAPFTLFGLPVYVTEYLPTHDSTASTGKNVVAVLGSVQDAFSIREWGPLSLLRDEISAASSARIKFYAMAFANSVFTRSKALVQLQVTNAAT